MFNFIEEFKTYGSDYIPYGIEVEECSHLWHKHVRPTESGMAIAACGSKYLLKTPTVENYVCEYVFSFNYLSESTGVTLYAGYDRKTQNGYGIEIVWNNSQRETVFTLIGFNNGRSEVLEAKALQSDFFPKAKEECFVRLTSDEKGFTAVATGAGTVTFPVKQRRGSVGFGRTNFIGEVVYRRAEFSCEESEKEVSSVKTDIPMLQGGTMPLNVSFRITEIADKRYLYATLDGGPQYRPSYKYYAPEIRQNQYTVESWYMTQPYVCYGDRKYYFSMGKINVSDGMHWREILHEYLGIIELPFEMKICIEGDADEYRFGYENCTIKGFNSQQGAGEYRFARDGKYLGEGKPEEYFELHSPDDKYAVSMIEDSVYEAETVRDHFRRCHYFCEDEQISFTLCPHTTKKYLTYKAQLQDVFGDKLEDMTFQDDLKLIHDPLPVGVYRMYVEVLYGGKLLTKLDISFEVFDKEGKKCPPLESGLPALYSTPNEQKYLDRDKFDPWNPGVPVNSEHYYGISSFLSYIGEQKRIWEVVKKFGRKWYAWLHLRLYGSREEATPEKHPDVVRNADYLAYDTDYRAGSYMFNYARSTMPLIEDFLDETEGAREYLGHTRGEKFDHGHLFKLLNKYGREWSDRLVCESVKSQRAVLAKFRTYNPDIKLACYGPFAVYASHLRSYSLLEYYALPTSPELGDLFYNGFCQFEDYPASCSYQTYRGPFAVGSMLAKMPNLIFYPEQYKSGVGGCIDGHVKHANPPLGRYDMPIWFNVTLARDYVFNTAVKTKDGYRFWDTYGFMHSDHPEDQEDFFIRNWKYILRHKPASKIKSAILFSEFLKEENVFEEDFTTAINWRVYYNRSEEGIAHIYETMRLYGMPSPSFAVWDTLDTLTAEDTDLIVLPSTVGLSAKRLAKIRELYAAGVSLFAVGRVDGLEDLFGVEYAPYKKRVYTLSAEGEEESIFPYLGEFNYRTAGAEIAASADGEAVIFTKGRTALINLPAYSVGRIHFFEHPYLGRATNSKLYFRTTATVLDGLCDHIAKADNGCGITLLRDESDRELLLAIDYSRHDQSEIETEREYLITLNGDYRDAEPIDGKPMRKMFSPDGRLDAVSITLRQHESALIHLKR